ncbi:MAG: MFS transporter [Planctomycetia bacterium]|nr:MFS transporter [Planctomycetia bacterium]
MLYCTTMKDENNPADPEKTNKFYPQVPLPERRKNHRGSLALLILFRVTRSIAGGMMIVALPYLVLNTLHDNALELGAIYVMGVMSTAVLAVGAGHLSDRWNHKGTLLLTGVMVPISALMVYVKECFPMLMAASVVGGFAATGSLIGGGVGGAAQPVQTSVIARLSSPDNRTRYYSVLAFLSGMAGAVGAMLVHYFSIRNTFLAAAIISGAGTVLLLFLRIPEYTAARSISRKQSNRAIRHFSITGALNGLSQGLITPFLIPFFVLVYHLSKSQMAVYTAIGSILASIALLTAPALEQRLGFVRSITFTRALGTALLIVMAIWHNLWIGLIIYLISPALRIAALPAQQSAIINRVEGRSMGRALAMNQVTRLSASSVAMICTGFLFDISEIEMPFFLYAGVMAVNIYLYYRFFGHDGQHGAVEPIPATEGSALEEKSANV